jgi:rhodanese-related sulfurtransferase
VTGGQTIEQLLDSARQRLVRLTPAEAEQASRAGAVVVDIRPAAQRASEGELPGSLVIERNVLEWRFDPLSDASLHIASHDLQVIVLCSEGYTSSLAAAALQDLGVHGATDVIGGYRAWRSSDVPSPAQPARTRTGSPDVESSGDGSAYCARSAAGGNAAAA